MIDASAVLREYLETQSPLVALTGTRIYPEANEPPEGTLPTDGACLCYKVRGGQPIKPRQLWPVSVQFKCYGATEVEANELYRALVDVLDCAHAGQMRGAEIETVGVTLREPETLWPFVLTFFTVAVANEGV